MFICLSQLGSSGNKRYRGREGGKKQSRGGGGRYRESEREKLSAGMKTSHLFALVPTDLRDTEVRGTRVKIIIRFQTKMSYFFAIQSKIERKSTCSIIYRFDGVEVGCKYSVCGELDAAQTRFEARIG